MFVLSREVSMYLISFSFSFLFYLLLFVIRCLCTSLSLLHLQDDPTVWCGL